MTHVALTCRRGMLFTIGLTVNARPGLRDPEAGLREALASLGGPVTNDVVELADAADVVLAFAALPRMLPGFDIRLESVVGSAIAIELLADSAEPVAPAWAALRAELATTTDGDASLAYGCAAARHFTRLVQWPVPEAIADQCLPEAPLVLWWVERGRIVTVDHEPFVVGRHPECDLEIASGTMSKRHVALERSLAGWSVRDLGSAGGFFLNGRRMSGRAELRPGMVIQFAIPNALVVLAVQPAR